MLVTCTSSETLRLHAPPPQISEEKASPVSLPVISRSLDSPTASCPDPRPGHCPLKTCATTWEKALSLPAISRSLDSPPTATCPDLRGEGHTGVPSSHQPVSGLSNCILPRPQTWSLPSENLCNNLGEGHTGVPSGHQPVSGVTTKWPTEGSAEKTLLPHSAQVASFDASLQPRAPAPHWEHEHLRTTMLPHPPRRWSGSKGGHPLAGWGAVRSDEMA
ncbi:hypothetical protein NDU88_000112 [Pleurodeles waltl]|uniref:Uncharacterized protein n=1 Tax=Pleurodeles waltl TaxID=8319 RepID=A0AAV7P0D9_PLEWA|nr:hypothetical protein NDU88_000112 [Pleurodeles waltl]